MSLNGRVRLSRRGPQGESGNDGIDGVDAFLSGAGSPVGVVSASRGPNGFYVDTSGTAGAVAWVKTGGAGADGWQVLYGDTDRREVKNALNGGVTATYARLRRRGNTVQFAFAGMTVPANFANIFDLPAGFEHNAGEKHFQVRETIVTGALGTFAVAYGAISFAEFIGGAGSDPARRLTGTFEWQTDSPWPTALPGTPVVD